MRKYRNIEPERWRAILGLLRWQLSLRVAGLTDQKDVATRWFFHAGNLRYSRSNRKPVPAVLVSGGALTYKW